MAESPLNLRSLYLAARSKDAELQTLDGSNVAYQNISQSIITMLQECRNLIQKLAIFSPNEASDEIGTSAIQYLGVDYLLAQLVLRQYDADRRRLLQKAAELFESFLVRLNTYELLSEKDRRLMERYQENSSGFQLASLKDATSRRNAKVSRFQDEKELKLKLQFLQNQSKQSSDDELTNRRLYFTELELYVGQSFEALDLIVQENAILLRAQDDPHRTSVPKFDPREGGRVDPKAFSERLDGSASQTGCGSSLLSKEGKPLQPFTIIDKRSQLRQGVFRPGHSLPTMSVEEYLEEEKRRGGIINGEAQTQEPTTHPDEDDMELADQETVKARAWDEYVEANPKGSGNTMNRG